MGSKRWGVGRREWEVGWWSEGAGLECSRSRNSGCCVGEGEAAVQGFSDGLLEQFLAQTGALPTLTADAEVIVQVLEAIGAIADRLPDFAVGDAVAETNVHG